MPLALERALLASRAVSADRTAGQPAFLRRHYRARPGGAQAYPSLSQPLPLLAGAAEVAEATPLSATQRAALLALETCLQGVGPAALAAEADGLPLLPLVDGSLGTLRAKVCREQKAARVF